MACKCCTPETETREAQVPARPADEPRDSGCGCGESCGCGEGKPGDKPTEEVYAA